MVRYDKQYHSDNTFSWISPFVNSRMRSILPCCLPYGKAGELQILCCQGIKVTDYIFTLDALALKPSGFCNVGVSFSNLLTSPNNSVVASAGMLSSPAYTSFSSRWMNVPIFWVVSAAAPFAWRSFSVSSGVSVPIVRLNRLFRYSLKASIRSEQPAISCRQRFDNVLNAFFDLACLIRSGERLPS